MRGWVVIAGFSGASAVALGAYAAHGLSSDPYAQGLAQQASQFQLFHAAALLGLAGLTDRLGRLIWMPSLFFCLGIVLFCGSLSIRALTGMALPVPFVTPVGGVCFMIGWLLTAGLAIYHKYCPPSHWRV